MGMMTCNAHHARFNKRKPNSALCTFSLGTDTDGVFLDGLEKQNILTMINDLLKPSAFISVIVPTVNNWKNKQNHKKHGYTSCPAATGSETDPHYRCIQNTAYCLITNSWPSVTTAEFCTRNLDHVLYSLALCSRCTLSLGICDFCHNRRNTSQESIVSWPQAQLLFFSPFTRHSKPHMEYMDRLRSSPGGCVLIRRQDEDLSCL